MWTLRLVSWSHRSLNLVTTPRESRDKIKFTLYKFETFCKNLNYLTNMWAQIPRLLTPLPPRHSFFFSDFIFIVATQNVSTDPLSTPSLWLFFSLVERTFRVIWRKRSRKDRMLVFEWPAHRSRDICTCELFDRAYLKWRPSQQSTRTGRSQFVWNKLNSAAKKKRVHGLMRKTVKFTQFNNQFFKGMSSFQTGLKLYQWSILLSLLVSRLRLNLQ